MTQEQIRENDIIQMKGASNWLTALPLHQENYVHKKASSTMLLLSAIDEILNAYLLHAHAVLSLQLIMLYPALKAAIFIGATMK